VTGASGEHEKEELRDKHKRKREKETTMKALRTSRGFTLIELLVVVAIIGILAAIAIPQFSAYRKKGYDSQVKSDARNAAVAEEAYFASAQAYITTGNCSTLPGMSVTSTVSCTLAASTTTPSYLIHTETTPTSLMSLSTGCDYASDTSPNLVCS
jgi:type IV pilus assembly protein PilA